MKNSKSFQINELTDRGLKKILLELAPKYHKSFKEEVESMTEIVNPNAIIKTGKNYSKQKELLLKKWNLNQQFIDITNEIIQFINNKCEGNPLVCL